MRFSAILSREFCRIQFQRTINGFSVFRFHVFKSFLPIFDKDYEIDLFLQKNPFTIVVLYLTPAFWATLGFKAKTGASSLHPSLCHPAIESYF